MRAAIVAMIVAATAVASAQPGSGSGSGSGSDPGSGSGSGSGSWILGSGSGSGSGTRKPPKIIIQIPADVVAPKVSASASPSQLRLGTQLTLFVTATFAQGVEVNLAEPVDLGGAFEVRKKVSSPDRVNPDGTRTREWQLAVYAWELGDLEIPEIGVTFTVAGKAGQVATNTVPVKVIGILGDVDDPKLLRANAPPTSLISRDWLLLIIAASVLGGIVAILVFSLLRRMLRRKNVALSGGAITVSRRIDMTSERALQRLLAIDRSEILADDDTRKRGYAEMVEVVREYLGARYHVATLDLTTLELVRSLAKVAPADERTAIEQWLERCDFVKYAGGRATAEAARHALEDARALVVAGSTIRATGASASQRMARAS